MSETKTDVTLKKILIVDDMAICREPIAEALRARGFDVACAATGKDALLWLQKCTPHAILLDMAMPGLSGLALLRMIRANPTWRAIPVIMLTDNADRDCVAGAASLNIQGYLLKGNFSLSSLLTRLQSCIAPQASAVGNSKASAKDTRKKPSVPSPKPS